MNCSQMQWTFVESLKYECQVVSLQEESWKLVDNIVQQQDVEVLWNSFKNKRVTVNSKELLLRENNGHASVAYNSIGEHLAWIRLNSTSSEANRPTLLYKALNSLKKHDLALSKLHLKVQQVMKNTHKYRQQSTQLNNVKRSIHIRYLSFDWLCILLDSPTCNSCVSCTSSFQQAIDPFDQLQQREPSSGQGPGSRV